MPVDLVGASVRGPGHRRDGLPNQDAWGHGSSGGYRVVVVADGLGSRPLAELGAKAACVAVREAFVAWIRHPEASDDVLLGLVHLFWRARLGAIDPNDAATTCLFAALRDDGSGWTGQLGDGLVLLDGPGGPEPLATPSERRFGNETAALGVTRRLSTWTTRRLPSGSRRLLLCTDGVADDLLPDRYVHLLDWLDDEILPEPPATRWRALAAELRAWPTPHHVDDKTLVFVRTTP